MRSRLSSSISEIHSEALSLLRTVASSWGLFLRVSDSAALRDGLYSRIANRNPPLSRMFFKEGQILSGCTEFSKTPPALGSIGELLRCQGNAALLNSFLISMDLEESSLIYDGRPNFGRTRSPLCPRRRRKSWRLKALHGNPFKARDSSRRGPTSTVCYGCARNTP